MAEVKVPLTAPATSNIVMVPSESPHDAMRHVVHDIVVSRDDAYRVNAGGEDR